MPVNAIAERVVGTLWRECLAHMIKVNEQHLRPVLAEYVRPTTGRVPAAALALVAPEGLGQRIVPPKVGIIGRPILGGLHHDTNGRRHEGPDSILPSHTRGRSAGVITAR
jgi:hypothetical protein